MSTRSPEGQADPAQPAEQRAQVHASGQRDDQRAARCRASGAVAISVTDTGIGIAPVDQDKIFEDFRQLDNSPTRAYGGTGLGLSICRRLAQMLDGRLTVAVPAAARVQPSR